MKDYLPSQLCDIATVKVRGGFTILLHYHDGEEYLHRKIFKTREEARKVVDEFVLENMLTDNPQ